MSDLGNGKPGPMASALLKFWRSLMIFCTLVLSFDVFVLKDYASVPFVALGMVGLLIPTVVNIISSINYRKDIKKKHEELVRTVQLEKLKQARIRERESLVQEDLFAKREMAENEAAKEALKNVNMAAFKPK